MILKKPYAFIIKHFKIIHAILGLLSLYSILRIISFISYFKSLLESGLTIIAVNDQIKKIYNVVDYVIPLVMIVICFFIFWIMSKKKKPNKFYLYAILISVVNIVAAIRGASIIATLSKESITASTISTFKDFYVFVLFGTIGELCISFSRAAGFNVGRFEFNSDLLNVEVSEKDSEEVEVSINLDVDDVKRDTQKGMRYFKYFLKENKMLIRGCFLGLVIIFTAVFGIKFLKNRKDYVKLTEFKNLINGFEMSINNSYIIDGDVNGNRLSDGKKLLVIDMNVKNVSKKDSLFSDKALSVTIDDETYRLVRQYGNVVSDIAPVYNDSTIKIGKSYKMSLIYEIPSNKLNKKILLSYMVNGKKKYLKLNPKKIVDKDTEIVEYKKGEELNFENSTLGDIKLKIDNYDVQQFYKLNYNYCLKDKSKCINSIEYLTPNPSNSNYNRGIIKINGNLVYSDNSYIKDINTLISKFGYIEYEKNGNKYIQKGNLYQVSSKNVSENNVYYFETDLSVKDADKIVLGFKIRDYDYHYVLKESN